MRNIRSGLRFFFVYSVVYSVNNGYLIFTNLKNVYLWYDSRQQRLWNLLILLIRIKWKYLLTVIYILVSIWHRWTTTDEFISTFIMIQVARTVQFYAIIWQKKVNEKIPSILYIRTKHNKLNYRHTKSSYLKPSQYDKVVIMVFWQYKLKQHLHLDFQNEKLKCMHFEEAKECSRKNIWCTF